MIKELQMLEHTSYVNTCAYVSLDETLDNACIIISISINRVLFNFIITLLLELLY